jgi:hypothetical protein
MISCGAACWQADSMKVKIINVLKITFIALRDMGGSSLILNKCLGGSVFAYLPDGDARVDFIDPASCSPPCSPMPGRLCFDLERGPCDLCLVNRPKILKI